MFGPKTDSKVLTPVKSNEAETHRRVRARKERSTRKSTQGVSLEAVQEAKKMVQVSSIDFKLSKYIHKKQLRFHPHRKMKTLLP